MKADVDEININLPLERAVKIDSVDLKTGGIENAIGATGNTGGSATAGTLMAKLNALLSDGNSISVLKSVQRGSFIIDTNKQTNVKVTINTVNTSKCQIDVWGQGYSTGGLVCSVTPSLSSNYMEINLVGYFSNGLNGAKGTWQVIEYV